MDEHEVRLIRIENKIDSLEGSILKLYSNGISSLGNRISSIEATCAARQREIASQKGDASRWLTVIGYLFTALNSLGLAVLVYILNHRP
jgi:hypothetical protein